MSRYCKKKPNKQNPGKNPSGKPPAMDGIIASVNDQKAPKVLVFVGGRVTNGTTVDTAPDTGADRTVCSTDTLSRLGIDTANLCTLSTELRATDNHTIYQLGEIPSHHHLWQLVG